MKSFAILLGAISAVAVAQDIIASGITGNGQIAGNDCGTAACTIIGGGGGATQVECNGGTCTTRTGAEATSAIASVESSLSSDLSSALATITSAAGTDGIGFAASSVRSSVSEQLSSLTASVSCDLFLTPQSAARPTMLTNIGRLRHVKRSSGQKQRSLVGRSRCGRSPRCSGPVEAPTGWPLWLKSSKKRMKSVNFSTPPWI